MLNGQKYEDRIQQGIEEPKAKEGRGEDGENSDPS
jgi:hypothetical protein